VYTHVLQVISPHKVFKPKFWMHFLFTQVSYRSYPPHPCWVTYSNNNMWRIKIIPQYVIFSSTSSLRSNILHSTLFPDTLRLLGVQSWSILIFWTLPASTMVKVSNYVVHSNSPDGRMMTERGTYREYGLWTILRAQNSSHSQNYLC
jgi:hypothetical protein